MPRFFKSVLSHAPFPGAMCNFAQTLSCLSVIVPDSLWHRVEESEDRKNGRKED
jgi:hypothetical protein